MGFTRGGPPLARIALGVGAPLTAAVVWGLFAAPRARFDVPLPAVLAVKAAFFLAAVLALYAMRHPSAAVALALVVTANIAVATAGR
ncbi:YrdB family protein [Streptomyces sp. RFCAC02]|uniref:YrdB family protein n=1 Tax=Streptomyces sp. RFCAC02 TaxID=2499143 RepID=UPI001F104CAE|nr:YrdB family protein [Streptomyces sp. RFCAC02]